MSRPLHPKERAKIVRLSRVLRRRRWKRVKRYLGYILVGVLLAGALVLAYLHRPA